MREMDLRRSKLRKGTRKEQVREKGWKEPSQGAQVPSWTGKVKGWEGV